MSEHHGPTPAYTPGQGRFVWHDLMTRDATLAEAFYKALFGWQVEPLDMGGTTYLMLRANGIPVGGLMQEDLPKGQPAHWLCYMRTLDIEKSVRRAVEEGGTVVVPPSPVPGVGRFSIQTDCAGAHIAFLEWNDPHEIPEDWHKKPGSFCWCELHSTDPAKATAFYTKVLGSTWNEFPMGPGKTYYLLVDGKQDYGGAMGLPEGVDAPSSWMPYVTVEDVDASYKKALELGATCCKEPGDIPMVGRFAVLSDPTGAAFVIFKTAHGHC